MDGNAGTAISGRHIGREELCIGLVGGLFLMDPYYSLDGRWSSPEHINVLEGKREMISTMI